MPWQEIRGLLRRRHRRHSFQDDDFNIRDLTEVLQSQEASSRVLTLLLAAIASVSLLVGGIGIMNIMLVSVTERTREIGLRMAVGARGRDILLQFLVEAVTLSPMGGVVGVTMVGVFFGFFRPGRPPRSTRSTPSRTSEEEAFKTAPLLLNWASGSGSEARKSRGRRVAGKGIQDLVGQVMIDKEFLADLMRDPARVLAGFDLTADERAAIMHALGSTAEISDRDRARALQNVMLKRWAT
jgi:hypothetical protein